MRSTVDYGVPAFYNVLPQYLKNELVRIEKRALSAILPSMSNNKACEVLGITPITEHHSQLCSKLFDAVVTDPNTSYMVYCHRKIMLVITFETIVPLFYRVFTPTGQIIRPYSQYLGNQRIINRRFLLDL